MLVLPFPAVRRPIAAALLACALLPGSARSQSSDSATVTTLSKVYSAEQAARGKELHELACLSCHKPAEHAGSKFWDTLVGKPVSDFFAYVRRDMPQDNPGSLSDEQYAAVIAYLFSLNGMPAGDTPLPGDSASLAKIRVVPPDTTRKGPGQ